MTQPEIIKKDMATILKEIEGKVPFYTPEWTFEDETDVGVALSRIFAYMSEVAIKKLNDAPQRHFLSFLETINASLIPARPARVPLTFLLSKGTPENVLIPALTQAAGQAPDGKPVIFETEKNIIATPSKLVSLLGVNNNNYLFNWDEVPGSENERLIKFLVLNYGAEWVKTATIEKTDSNKIEISSGKSSGKKSSGSLTFDPKQNKVELMIDGETDEFTVKIENGKRNVYKEDEIFDHTPAIDGAGSSEFFGVNENLQEHILYIGDKNLLNVKTAQIKIEGKGIEKLANPQYLSWEYGSEVIEKVNGKELKKIQWKQLTQASGTNWLSAIKNTNDPVSEIQINGLKSRWIRCRIINSKMATVKDTEISGLKIAASPPGEKSGTSGITPDMAFLNDIPVDLSDPAKDIYPFGKKPQIFNTFYIACDDAFSKKEYKVEISFDLTPGKPSGQTNTGGNTAANYPQLSWEFWDGMAWNSLKGIDLGDFPGWAKNEECNGNSEGSKGASGNSNINSIKKDTGDTAGNEGSEDITVTIASMPEVKPTTVNGKEKYWIRVRLVGGDYGKEYKITSSNNVEPGTFCPPMLKNLKINYLKGDGEPPEYILAKNNLAFKNCGDELKVKNNFKPFEPIPNIQPTLYFGFNRALRGGPISVFISTDESIEYSESSRPRLQWQYLQNNKEWVKPDVLDETNGLTKSGMVQFIIPGEMAGEKMFGKEDLYWIRAVAIEKPFETIKKALKDIPPASKVLGLYLNSAWALQSMTVTDEIIGGSTGERNQAFRLMNKPVLKETIWVNEISTLTEMERKALKNTRKFEEKKDDKGNVTELWIKWDEISDFLESEYNDRHYAIDRTTGEFHFGDGVHGMIPSIGMNNIRVTYSTGGGKPGNLAALSISKLQSTIAFVDKAYNPVASDGGADTEEVDALIKRAPAVLKHRKRAVALEDYQKLAKEASKKVARVKVLPNSNAKGEQKVGTVTIVIVPESPDAKPVPTPELRHMVERYLRERCSNLATISVIQPSYIVVKVSAVLVTNDIDTIPVIEQKASSRVIEFFHPLYGGVEGKGWDFGSVPCISDIFSLLESIENVDYVRKLTIQLDNEDGSKITEITKSSDILKLPEYTLLFSGEHDISAQWITKRE
ncbi:MAG: putative baseplate assembly protein [Candidatus Methanoperedens sp.]|nr:putative baseplate assembly protein [Candidatus Methanoperedens sp.]